MVRVMDRASLEQMLERGLSLAEIGRKLGLHESTVSYWLRKHGLEATHRAKHAARGGLSRAELEPMVEAGMSASQIADLVGLSKSTVRHWLREHGLQTQWAKRRIASDERRESMMLCCPKHGETTFRLRSGGGYRCARCRAEAVVRRRRKVKRLLVEEGGGQCQICGYDRCISALEFHHLVPAEKSFSLSHRGVARSIAKARAEASKCMLLCANCHAEVEAGLVSLTP
jgi:DNA-binding CsgD family transcriptional regulator